MRLAIADPPYLGQSKHYPEHAEAAVWDDPATHVALVQRLGEEFDGWVLACNVRMLRLLLPVAQQSVRVGVWAKTRAGGTRPTLRVAYAHEHVLWSTPRRGGRADMRRTDALIAPATRQTGVIGAKPECWTHWVLSLLGYLPGEDQVVDLFPETGAVGPAVGTYRPPCPRCGLEVVGMRSDAVFCSTRCRVAAHRSRQG